MVAEGHIVLFRFPQTDQTEGKLRPALVLRSVPGRYHDWLICMISSQMHYQIPAFDEVITPQDVDFKKSGLKLPSVIRIGRLAVVESDIFIGRLGEIDSQRLYKIKQTLSAWILSA